MDNEVEACSECVCDHVRRSLAGIGNLLMEIRRNTVSEIDPLSGFVVFAFGAIGRASRAGREVGTAFVWCLTGFFRISLWDDIFEAILRSLVGSSSAKPNSSKHIVAIRKSSNNRRGI